MSATADISVLEKKISDLLATIASTAPDEANLRTALTVEAGQCSWRIAEAMGPQTLEQGQSRLSRDLYKFLTGSPEKVNAEGHSDAHPGYDWLYASPFALTTIRTEDNQTNINGEQALAIARGYKVREPKGRGNKWESLGSRGKQHIMLLKRTRVSYATLSGAFQIASQSIGQLKASWAATTLRYIPGKRIPAWLRKQIPVVEENGKHLLNDVGLQSENPWLEFGSAATGVESNTAIRAKIESGMASTAESLRAKVAKVLRGYKYRWETGQVYREKFEDSE